MLTSSTQLQNRSFHVVERTRTSVECPKMKNAHAKRTNLLFFTVKYANLWCSCCHRRLGCLSLLMISLTVYANSWSHITILSRRGKFHSFGQLFFCSARKIDMYIRIQNWLNSIDIIIEWSEKCKWRTTPFPSAGWNLQITFAKIQIRRWRPRISQE